MRQISTFLCIVFFCFSVFGQNLPDIYLPYEVRLMFSYVLDASASSDQEKIAAFDKILSVAIKMKDHPEKVIKVKNMSEFLVAYRGDWPNSHDLKTDLKIIEEGGLRGRVKIVPVNAQVRTQIEKFYQNQIEFLKDKFPSADFESFVKNDNATVEPHDMTLRLLHFYSNLDSSEGRALKLKFINSLETYFKEIMDKMTQIGVTASQTETKLSKPNPLIEILLKVGLARYFEVMDLSSKKQIISALMGENINLDNWGKFAVMVANCGPQFQKLLQVIARDQGLPAGMQVAFEKLESAGRPVPWVLGKKILDSEAKNFDIVSVDTEALGIGTMAQTHSAKLRIKDIVRNGVVRFLKPEIENRLEQDDRALRVIAPEIDAAIAKINPDAPSLTSVVEEVHEMVAAELDLTATIDQQKKGREIYSKEMTFYSKGKQFKLLITVPEIFDPKTSQSHIIAQEKAPGKKLHSMAQNHREMIPNLEVIVAENLAKVWAQSTFFDTGFFHSDLHPGNFLVDVTGQTIKVSILDFGMSGVISDKEKSLFLIMGLAAELKKSDMIADVLWKLSLEEKNGISQSELKRRVEEQLQIKPLKSAQWIIWGLNQRLRAPSSIINLSRGMAALDMMLKNAGTTKTTYTIGVELAKKNVLKTVKLLRLDKSIKWRDIAAGAWQISLKALNKSNLENNFVESDVPEADVQGQKLKQRMCSKIFGM